MSASFDVAGRIAVVTGGSSGIGLRFVHAFLEAGAKVVAISRSLGELTPSDSLVHIAADLSDPQAIELAATEAQKPFGPADILVNAAGVNVRKNSDTMSLDEWQFTLNLNLTAPYLMAKHLSASMRKQGWGKIVNIASIQTERAMPNSIAYGATKGGIGQLTRAMAEEWSRAGVSVNAIAPGFFPTPLTAPVFGNQETVDKLAAQTCIGRNGELDDLVGPLLFLSSPASDYVTGQVIFVDGGFTAK